MGKDRNISSEEEVQENSSQCRCIPDCKSDEGDRNSIRIMVEDPSESSEGEELEGSQGVKQFFPRKSSDSTALSQKVSSSKANGSKDMSERPMSSTREPVAAHDCQSIPGAYSDREALQKGTSVRSVNAYNVYSYGQPQPKSMYTVSTKRSAVSKRSGNESARRQMKTTERTKVGMFELSIAKGPVGKSENITGNLSTDIAKDLDFHLDGNTKLTEPMEGEKEDVIQEESKSKRAKSVGMQPAVEHIEEGKKEVIPEKSRKSGLSRKSKSKIEGPKEGQEQEAIPEKSKKSVMSKKSKSVELQLAEEGSKRGEEQEVTKVKSGLSKAKSVGYQPAEQGQKEVEEQEVIPKKSKKSDASKKSKDAEMQLTGKSRRKGNEEQLIKEKSALSKKTKSAAFQPAGGEPAVESMEEISEVTRESHPDFLDNLLLKYMYKMKKRACRNTVERDSSLVDSAIQTILNAEEVPSQMMIAGKISKSSRSLQHELTKLSVEIDAINDFSTFLNGREKATAFDCEKDNSRGGLPKFTSVSVPVMKLMMASIQAVIKELSHSS